MNRSNPRKSLWRGPGSGERREYFSKFIAICGVVMSIAMYRQNVETSNSEAVARKAEAEAREEARVAERAARQAESDLRVAQNANSAAIRIQDIEFLTHLPHPTCAGPGANKTIDEKLRSKLLTHGNEIVDELKTHKNLPTDIVFTGATALYYAGSYSEAIRLSRVVQKRGAERFRIEAQLLELYIRCVAGDYNDPRASVEPEPSIDQLYRSIISGIRQLPGLLRGERLQLLSQTMAIRSIAPFEENGASREFTEHLYADVREGLSSLPPAVARDYANQQLVYVRTWFRHPGPDGDLVQVRGQASPPISIEEARKLPEGVTAIPVDSVPMPRQQNGFVFPLAEPFDFLMPDDLSVPASAAPAPFPQGTNGPAPAPAPSA